MPEEKSLKIKVIPRLFVGFRFFVCFFFNCLGSLGVLIRVRFKHLNIFMELVLNNLVKGKRTEIMSLKMSG